MLISPLDILLLSGQYSREVRVMHLREKQLSLLSSQELCVCTPSALIYAVSWFLSISSGTAISGIISGAMRLQEGEVKSLGSQGHVAASPDLQAAAGGGCTLGICLCPRPCCFLPV